MTAVLPSLIDLGDDLLVLVSIAAKHSLLPNPVTVAKFGDRAAFPTVRDQKNRISTGEHNGRPIMFDDNTTPRWAILWCHGFDATAHPRGRTIAHVWGAVKDPSAYTHLANLALMPEFLASLSDKQGPLAPFFQFHAWNVYGWKPNAYAEPTRPEGYDSIVWRYLPEQSDPQSLLRGRVQTLTNQRTNLLRTMMFLEGSG